GDGDGVDSGRPVTAKDPEPASRQAGEERDPAGVVDVRRPAEAVEDPPGLGDGGYAAADRIKPEDAGPAAEDGRLSSRERCLPGGVEGEGAVEVGKNPAGGGGGGR